MHRSCFANIVPEFDNPVVKGCLKGVIVTVLSIFEIERISKVSEFLILWTTSLQF